jgi:ribosomal protein RSM22 (predicted rRNA methylase)
VDLSHALNDALEAATADFPLRDLSASVDRLIARYRTPGHAEQPILLSAVDVAAYAAYRMPATWGAVRAALDQFALRVPDFAPTRLLDIGGGTGAAAWAAADTFPSLTEITVADQVTEALDLGRRLAAQGGSAALRAATWQPTRFQDQTELPAADLVTVSYVLSELSEADQGDLVRRAAAAGTGAVAVIEPGTPAGFARVLAARDVLLGLGMTIAAPCPSQAACPLVGSPTDWCHFVSRVNRSPLHRRLKAGTLGHEDEKFSYVIATKAPGSGGPTTPTASSASTAPAALAGSSRVLRHPQKRKGLVTMQLCTPDDGVRTVLIAKSQGAAYRAARDAEWGDAWPASTSHEVGL